MNLALFIIFCAAIKTNPDHFSKQQNGFLHRDINESFILIYIV